MVRLFVYFVVLITLFNLSVLYANVYIFGRTLDSYNYIKRQEHQVDLDSVGVDTISSYWAKQEGSLRQTQAPISAPVQEIK